MDHCCFLQAQSKKVGERKELYYLDKIFPRYVKNTE